MAMGGDFRSTLQLNKAIGACARGASWVEAVYLLRKGRTPRRDVISFNSTANACVRGEQWQLALLLFSELEESQRTVISYNIAINAYEKVSAWVESLELLRQMERQMHQTDATSCNTAISSCGKSSQWQLASFLAVWQPDLVGINAAIDACARASEWEHSLRLLSFLPRWALQRDVISFTSAASACEKGTQWPLVLLLLEQMEKEQLEGNVMTYNTCISSLSKGGEWTTALRLFEHLETSGSCTVTSYGCAMGALSVSKVWPAAQQMIQSIRSREVRSNMVIYNSCMNAADVAWNWPLVLLQDLEVCNLEATSSSFGAALQALKMVPGQWAAALQLMPGGFLRNTITYNSAISICAQSHQKSLACNLFEEMRGLSLQCDAVTFTAALSATSWSEAVQLLEQSRHDATTSDLKMWSSLLSSCEATGQWRHAMRALESCRGNFQCDDTAYSIVISACKRAVMGRSENLM